MAAIGPRGFNWLLTGTRGNASFPRGTDYYLCTYHITFVRTINRNQSEPEQTILSRSPLSLPALPSVPPRIRHSGVASPLRVRVPAAAARILEAGPAEERQFGWWRGGGDVA